MIVRKDYTVFLEDIGPCFQADVKEQGMFFSYNNGNENNIQASQLNIPPKETSTPSHQFPMFEDVNDPRQHFPTYGTGQYFQKLDYIIKDEKKFSYEPESSFIALPNKSGFQLRVENLEMNCSDCTVAVGKGIIKFSQPVIFDYSSRTMRVSIPNFCENRVLMKDGSSIVNGYKLTDFDNNQVLVRNKASVTSIENDMSGVTYVSVSADYGFISFENGFFDGKDIKLKARGLCKIDLGVSAVKSIAIDKQMASVDDAKITKI